MTSDGRIPDSELEREIAANLAAEGYTVIYQPARDLIPFDLGPYRPDLLAMKPGDNLIVEVKGSARTTTIDRLRDVAEEVARHPGWRLVLFTGTDAEGSGTLPLLTWGDLRFKVQEGERLLSSRAEDAAFLLLWTCLEAAMRLRAREVNLPVERFPSSTLIRQLYSHGEISMDQLDQALVQLDTRNKAVHGFAANDVKTAAQAVARLARELVQEWGGQPIPAHPPDRPNGA